MYNCLGVTLKFQTIQGGHMALTIRICCAQLAAEYGGYRQLILTPPLTYTATQNEHTT